MSHHTDATTKPEACHVSLTPQKGDGPPPNHIRHQKTCHCGGQAALLVPCCRRVCNHTTPPSVLADSSSSTAAKSVSVSRCRNGPDKPSKTGSLLLAYQPCRVPDQQR